MRQVTYGIGLMAVAGLLTVVFAGWQHFTESWSVDDLAGKQLSDNRGVEPGQIVSAEGAAFVTGTIIEQFGSGSSLLQGTTELHAVDKPGPMDLFSDLHVVICGNVNFSREEILDNLDLPEQATFPLLKNLVKDHVTNFYRTHGFPEVSVEEVRMTAYNPTTLSLTLEEGSAFRLDRLEIHGLGGVTESEVLEFYSHEGELFNWVQLSDSDRKLQLHYRQLGYLDAEVRSQTVLIGGQGGLCYKVMIEEGPQYRVGSVSSQLQRLEGFPFKRGDIFSFSALNEFLRERELKAETVRLIKNREDSSVDVDLRTGFISGEVSRLPTGSGQSVL